LQVKVPVEQMCEWDPWNVAVAVVAALEHSLVPLKANLFCASTHLFADLLCGWLSY
jgi:hypothetical protein